MLRVYIHSTVLEMKYPLLMQACACCEGQSYIKQSPTTRRPTQRGERNLSLTKENIDTSDRRASGGLAVSEERKQKGMRDVEEVEVEVEVEARRRAGAKQDGSRSLSLGIGRRHGISFRW